MAGGVSLKVAIVIFIWACSFSAYGVESRLLLNIPASNASDALDVLAEQSGHSLFYLTNDLQGATSNALNGSYTLPDALQALLKGTPLTAVVTDKKVIVVSIASNNQQTQVGNNMKFKKKPLSGMLVAMAILFGSPQVIAQDNYMEEVVVTGVRGSIQSSLNIKRNAEGVVDAISIEDIGEFPDQNIAEALQRITGVQITRQGGEGRTVAIRGLGDDFVFTTLNGRSLTSGGSSPSFEGAFATPNRGFNFDILASETIGSLEVHKSTNAALEEGGLAGVVNINSLRPFDLGKERIAFSVFANHGDRSGDTEPRISGIYSNVFNDGKVGFLISASYFGTSNNYSFFQNFFNRPSNIAGLRNIDIGGDGTIEFENVGIQELVNLHNIDSEDERVTIDSSLQFRPTDNMVLTFDVLYSQRESQIDQQQFRHVPFVQFVNRFEGTDANQGPLILDSADDIQVVDGIATFLRVGPRSDSLGDNDRDPWSQQWDQQDDSDLQVYGFNLDWANDSWSVRADAYYSKSERDFDLYVARTNYALFDPATRQLSDAFSLVYDNTGSFPVIGFEGGSLTDDSNNFLFTSFAQADKRVTEDDEWALQLDFEKSVEFGLVSSIDFGMKYKSAETQTDAFQAQPFADPSLFNLPSFIPGGEVDAGVPVGIQPLTVSNGLVLASTEFGGRTYEWLVPDISDFTRPDVTPFPQSGSFFNVQEDSLSAYVKLDLEGEIAGKPMVADIGVRYIQTDQTSSGFGITEVRCLVPFEITGLVNPPACRPQAINSTGGTDLEVVTVDRDYSEVLPSANVRFDLSEDWVLRLAAGKVLTRPPLSSLTNALSSFSDLTYTTSFGNPNLDPFEATQYDVSVEWYFSETGALSIGYFHKDVESFVTFGVSEEILPSSDPIFLAQTAEQQTFSVTRPVNGQGATVQGIEFSYQQFFDNLPAPFDGLGVGVNYTYVDAESDDPNESFTGVSENNYNLTAYYDKGPITVRLAYSYRDEFEIPQGFPANGRFVEEAGYLDFSANYQLTDNIQVVLEAINLTEEETRSNINGNSLTPANIEDVGRRLLLGVRGVW